MRSGSRWFARLGCVGLLLGSHLCFGQSAALTTRTAPARQAQSDSQVTLDVALEERRARDWGLQQDEWARYRQLMQGPLGVYSPNLDPLTALGIEARSAEERHHFAQLQVQAEGRRTQKILEYQRAYDDAWKRLHPTLTPLSPLAEGAEATPRSAPNTGARSAVFIKEDCSLCDQRVLQLQAAGRPFDLYMVGSRQEDSRIRQWAARVGIDATKVRAGTITLNHDAGRWLSLGGQRALPAVLVQVDGQWQRE